jgi:hypothetical protein
MEDFKRHQSSGCVVHAGISDGARLRPWASPNALPEGFGDLVVANETTDGPQAIMCANEVSAAHHVKMLYGSHEPDSRSAHAPSARDQE